MSPPRQPTEAVNHADDLAGVSSLGLSTKNDGIVDDVHKVPLKDGNMTGSDSNGTEATSIDNQEDIMEGGKDLKSETREDEIDSGEAGSQKAVELTQVAEEPANLQDAMESSTATLKPEAARSKVPASLHLSPVDQAYLDPTPKTPLPSQPPSRSSSTGNATPHHGRNADNAERSPTRSDSGFDEKISMSEDERELSSRSEIQSIMEQFSEEGQGPGQEEIMSPRLGVAGPLLGSPIQHPPRKSSLEPLNPGVASAAQSIQDLRISSPSTNSQPWDTSDVGPAVPPKPGSIRSFGQPKMGDDRSQSIDTPTSPSLYRPPPPEPEPEPDLPFDFHRFLEQLRHRTADPVAKFLRSFLQEFGKKQWMVHEQVKIISDFLAFITNKMAQCEVWREVSDAEFDNAREGMEKLVMNRLYTQTFSPAIPPPQPIPGAKPRRRAPERLMGPGRRGQHQEDVERDDILAQKVSIYGWIREEHLDIPAVGDSGKRFLILAQQGLLKHSKSDSSADSFMPLLIYVVLQANPEHLVSNVQYILRFRNQDKLGGEAGYYLSSLLGAIQFIENLDRTTLTISDEDFEKNVEAAVSAIAEKHQAEIAEAPPTQLSEKSGLSHPEVTPRHSMEGESSTPRKSTSSNEYSGDDEKAAMGGLLRTIQRPLTSIGRIFSEDSGSSQSGPVRTPLPGNTPRTSPNPRVSTDGPQPQRQPPTHARQSSVQAKLTAEDAAARQASAETAEAHRIQRAEHANIVETLSGMFPDLDKEIISDVVTQKDGRVGLAVDACLALGS
ncbi:Uncharacterized protein BP5553_01887 [Venustampulla echinocandica]|uniref:Uncharacterized protein n=1 Tax=Venustampulla echinocandica TaxID=2656787 RepID=A0A370U2A2_9HELO|nr:Uncharacterized protein BP5553_01887 [Venustampulla echinocandica]RDL41908.1 Uncharacterized protein BP5553_01887 [Venustampulla echinocandica]